MIRKILIANRGEIAVRVMHSCREMGIQSVAVFSEADRAARHVLYADEACLIGPAASKDSYLDIEKIIQAAKIHKADAIHPGYGFLSENAAFARRCKEENIIFIGKGYSSLLGKKETNIQKLKENHMPIIETDKELAKFLQIEYNTLRYLVYHRDVITFDNYLPF